MPRARESAAGPRSACSSAQPRSRPPVCAGRRTRRASPSPARPGSRRLSPPSPTPARSCIDPLGRPQEDANSWSPPSVPVGAWMRIVAGTPGVVQPSTCRPRLDHRARYGRSAAVTRSPTLTACAVPARAKRGVARNVHVRRSVGSPRWPRDGVDLERLRREGRVREVPVVGDERLRHRAVPELDVPPLDRGDAPGDRRVRRPQPTRRSGYPVHQSNTTPGGPASGRPLSPVRRGSGRPPPSA